MGGENKPDKSTPPTAPTPPGPPAPPAAPRAGARSTKSAAITLVGNAGQIAIGVVSTAILARLLAPGDFGLMAMALTFFAFVGSISDFGLPHALVHHETFDPRHAAGLFRLNRRLSILLALVMAGSGPLVAWLYGRQEIIGISVVVACVMCVAGILNLHVALMRRQLRFKALAAGQMAGLIVGSIAAIVAAYFGAGVWALVLQMVIQYASGGIFAWWWSRWRPTRLRDSSPVSADELSELRRYARQVAASRVIANVGRNLDRVLVGTLAGAGPLGLYQKAYQWSVLPVQQVHQPLLNVAVSALSRLQRRDVDRYRLMVGEALLLVLSVTMPVTLLLLVEAGPVVRLLLGTQWLDAAPLFRVLCIAAFTMGLTAATKWVYLAEGRTAEQLRWTLLSTPVMLGSVIAGAVIGGRYKEAALGTAIGFSAASVLLVVPSLMYCTRGSKLRPSDLWWPVWRPAVASMVAALITWLTVGTEFVNYISGRRSLAHATIALLLFGLIYIVLWLLLPGGRRAFNRCLEVGSLLKS